MEAVNLCDEVVASENRMVPTDIYIYVHHLIEHSRQSIPIQTRSLNVFERLRQVFGR